MIRHFICFLFVGFLMVGCDEGTEQPPAPTRPQSFQKSSKEAFMQAGSNKPIVSSKPSEKFGSRYSEKEDEIWIEIAEGTKKFQDNQIDDPSQYVEYVLQGEAPLFDAI